jgi:O-antigen/teichoic acid export membrane protein
MVDQISGNVTADVAEVAPQPLRSVATRLAKSFAIYGFANFGIRSLNFLLVLVYAHYLRPSDYGIIYLAEIVAAFLILFGNLSIDSALQRFYFQYNSDSAELRNYLGTVIRFGIFTIGVLLALALLCGDSIQIRLARHADVPFYPYIAIAIVTAAATQGAQYRLALYQAERRPKRYATLSFLLFALTALGSVYGVVILRRGAIGMLQGKLFAALLVLMVAMWSLRTLLTAHFEWRFVRESLAFSLPLVPHQVMAGGLIVADRFILEHYRDLNEVGIYSLAYTIGMVMFLVTQSLSQAWLPMFFELAGGSEENRQVLGRICSGLVVFLTAIGCIGMLLSPPLIHIALDYRYHAAIRIVPFVIMGYLFHALFSLLHLSIMHAKRTQFVFLISLVAFSVNIALNFAMIPRWGMYGAAWATTIAYGVEAMGAYIFAQRFFRLPYRQRELFACLGVSGAALWLMQSDWIFRWHGSLLVFCTFASLAILSLAGGNDLRLTIAIIRDRRKPGAHATG